MTNEDRFKGFDFTKNEYEQEARGEWGNEAVENVNKKVIDNTSMQKKMPVRDRALARLRDVDASSGRAQAGIARWVNDLNRMGDDAFGGFQALGQMYVEDERVKDNIDHFGDGVAEFMR